MNKVKELNTFAVGGNRLDPKEPVHLTLYNEDDFGNTSDDVVILLDQRRLAQLMKMLSYFVVSEEG